MYICLIIFYTFVEYEEEASTSRKGSKVSRKEDSSRCGIKRKQKENPKGEQDYVNDRGTFVTEVQRQSTFCHIGHLICHVLPVLGYIAVEFMIAFHLKQLQFYEYVVVCQSTGTCVCVYVQLRMPVFNKPNTRHEFTHIFQCSCLDLLVPQSSLSRK